MKKIISLSGVVLLLFLFGSAFNQEWEIQAELDEDKDLAAGKVISISPCALKPTDYLDMEREWSTLHNYAYISSYETTGITLTAPVNLPHKAVIKKFAAYILDDNPDEYIRVSLWRSYLFGTHGLCMVEVGSINSAPSQNVQVHKDTFIEEPLVANHSYCYYLKVHWTRGGDTDLSFYGAKIVLE